MSEKSKWNLELNLRSIAWGIHFDAKNLYLTALHNKLNQLRYRGHEVLTDFEGRSDEEILDFIEEFQAEHKVKRGDVFMLLPRTAAMIQIAEFPREAEKNIEEVMEYQLGNYFPVELEAYSFFPQIIGRSDQLKVMIVAVKKEYLGHCFGFIRRWGLKVAGLSMDTFGLVNGLVRLRPEAQQERVIVFRSFPEGLEMAALNEGRLVTSHFFPVQLGEDVEAAPAPESILTEVEQGFSLARMDPNEVEHYLWTGDDHLNLKQYLQEEVGIPFETWSDGVGTEIPEIGLTGFGAAVSAVVDKLHLDLNMLPEKQRKRHKRLPVMLGSAAMIILALFFMAGEVKAYRKIVREHAKLEQRHGQVLEQMNQISDARVAYEEKIAELELYKRFQTNRMLVKLLYSMSELPEDTYLTNLNIKNNNNLTLQGESDDPFKIQRLLSEMPFLRDVKPSNAITAGRNKDGKRRFNFKAEIVLEEFN